MNTEKPNNVRNFGRDNPEALARAAGVLQDRQPTYNDRPINRPERRLTVGKVLGGAATVAAAGFLLLPRPDQAPVPQREAYLEQVRDAAQVPYDAETDEVIVDGIRIKPNDPDKNIPSEAILGHPDVQAYVEANPDESSAITTSALTVPSMNTSEYVVVGRDVDEDGDTDAVAVPVELSGENGSAR